YPHHRRVLPRRRSHAGSSFNFNEEGTPRPRAGDRSTTSGHTSPRGTDTRSPPARLLWGGLVAAATTAVLVATPTVVTFAGISFNGID
ncbi:MAG: hypothetical protein ACRDZS_11230, partial [Acidimicrobiales bacterium]